MIFGAFFKLRGPDTYTNFFAVIFSGRHDLPSDARAFSLTFFEASSFSVKSLNQRVIS